MAELLIDNDMLRIHFGSFGLQDYDVFLKAKRLPEAQIVFHPEDETYSIETPARFAPLLGMPAPAAVAAELPLSSFLFEDQAAIVRLALDAKRFACWSDCGLGKTLIELEFARQVVQCTGGRVLIVTLNEIVNQTIDEAHRWYRDKRKKAHTLDVMRLMSRQEMRGWMRSGAPGIAITNYEKWNPKDLADQVVNEARHLAGVILDESSRLKGGGGKQKWALIKSCRGIEYKLSCTATPAPRHVVGFELKESYHRAALSNIEKARQKIVAEAVAEQSLFDRMKTCNETSVEEKLC